MDRINTFMTNKNCPKIRVDPLVYMSILDSYQRRDKREGRAIGTLMGVVSEGNLLEITDCFQVVHKESAEKATNGLSFDAAYHGRMVALRHAVHPKENVVGWFSVGQEKLSSEYQVQIHNFYRAKESKFIPQPHANFISPVYLQIDTSIRDCPTPIDIKAYSSEFIAGTDNSLMQFYETEVGSPSEVGSQSHSIMQMLAAACAEKYPNKKEVQIKSLDAFERQLDSLESLIAKAELYINNVISGKEKGNPEVGRALMKALSGAGKGFDDVISGATSDTLMVSYLSNLCKTQIVLAEKIQNVLGGPQE